MLRIALLELRAKKRWTKRFVASLAILSILAVAMSAYSLLNGIKIDRGIYSANVKIDDPKFVKSDNPDISIYDGRIVVRGDLKSLSAFDEFRNYIRRVYNEWIGEKFGSYAFPILIRVIRIPTKSEFVVSTKSLKRVIETVKKESGVTPRAEEKREEKTERLIPKRIEGGVKEKGGKNPEFLTPDELKPPSLLGKLIYAFGFVIPIYFVVQVYSSSAIEDKVKRRLELLFVAEDEWKVLVGKMLPYLAMSLALTCVVVVAFGKPLGVLLLVPVVLFLLALSTFTAMISRSYREMTFLTIIISIFITTYLFIPAMFTAVPVSRVSPITLLLAGRFEPKEYIISTLQFYVMSAVLFYLSLNSIEVMHSQSNPVEKVVEISTRVVKSYPAVFLASLLSIPFVFVMEFFTLSLIFAIEHAFVVVVLMIALVEEFFKGLFIYSAFKNGLNPYVSAFLSASGFLIGEKTILFSLVPIKFVEFLPVPLIAHVLAAFIFVATMRFGFKRALLASSTFHAIYDGVILWKLLG